MKIKQSELAYELYGFGKVTLVIEMGLGATMAEWRNMAKRLSQKHTVLLYRRAGYGDSGVSTQERTPENIVSELYQLLKQISHEDKLTLLAHSQGGMYAWAFAQRYPETVRSLVLLDPLSPEDYRFREELSEEEFKKSGVDKSEGLRLNLKLTNMHLGWLVKRMMAGAPPFYYDNSFSKEERKEILDSLGKPQTYRTALSEYDCVHNLKAPAGMPEQTYKLCVPVTLVTHNSAISCREIQQFGGASETQAEKIEALWQDIMDFYLRHSSEGKKVCAEHSSHYIHLTDPELVCRLV